MPSVPVKRVRYIASGHEATINASDFDPRIHEDIAGGRAPEPPRAAAEPLAEGAEQDAKIQKRRPAPRKG